MRTPAALASSAAACGVTLPAVLTPSVSSTSTRARTGNASRCFTASTIASPIAVSRPASPISVPVICFATASMSKVMGVNR